MGDERPWRPGAYARILAVVRRWVMRAHPGRTLSLLVSLAIAVAVALVLVLALEQGLEPAIVLVGTVLALVVYGAGYVVVRRRHW
jgi:hypothetical protein